MFFYCFVNYRVVAAGNGTFRIITHLLRQISWILEILRTSLRRAPDPLNPWSSWWAFSQLHQGISSFFSNLSEILHMGIICVYFKKNLNNFFLKSPPPFAMFLNIFYERVWFKDKLGLPTSHRIILFREKYLKHGKWGGENFKKRYLSFS